MRAGVGSQDLEGFLFNNFDGSAEARYSLDNQNSPHKIDVNQLCTFKGLYVYRVHEDKMHKQVTTRCK